MGFPGGPVGGTMFHVKHDESLRQLRRLSAELGVSLSEEHAALLLAHLELVIEANQHLNLTSITAPEEGLRLHVVDSLAVVPLIKGGKNETITDIGSGAGFPGIPIAVVCPGRVRLLESRGRRAAFLQDAVDALGLDNAEIVGVRAEAVLSNRSLAGSTTVTARAVSSLPALVELAAPILAFGGALIAMKGPITDDELARGDRAGAIVGMERTEVLRFALPGGNESRTLVMFQKSGESTITLPRNPGKAQKQPLA